MSEENRKVTIVDSKERVALELMQYILGSMAGLKTRTKGTEEEYFDLYRKCRKAVHGHNPE